MEVIFGPASSVCRGCLATGRRMVNATLFNSVFRDVTGIDIVPSDGLPQSLCYECYALLRKSDQFRSKVIKSHNLLCQYVHRSIPFSYDGSASPHLTRTSVECYEFPGAQAEQTVEQINHNEVEQKINSVLDDTGASVVFKTESVDVKVEFERCDDEHTIEECDVHDRDRAGLGTQGRDVVDTTTNEVNESEQVAVKCERTICSSDVTDKLQDNYEILVNCDQIEDNFKAISTHSEFRDEHVKHNINIVNDSSHSNLQSYICETCNKCFVKKKLLIDHIRKYSAHQLYKCDVCDKSFNHNHNCLNMNMRTQTGDKPYKCDVCMKKFSYKSEFTRHYRTHTGERPYQCKICMKCFKDKSNLMGHYQTHTNGKPYKCDVCMKHFRTQSALNEHYRIHTGDKPFKCDICMKGFRVQFTLKQHYRIHTGDKPHKCEVCMKGFTGKTALTQHYMIHTGDRPFKCDICMRSFTQKGALLTHNRIHAGTKPYKCDVCMKSFTVNSSLTQHYRIHTGDKPYKCNVCMQCFSYKAALNTHYRIHIDNKR